jgi:hypothetical protein
VAAAVLGLLERLMLCWHLAVLMIESD